jgi:hypothetical protein
MKFDLVPPQPIAALDYIACVALPGLASKLRTKLEIICLKRAMACQQAHVQTREQRSIRYWSNWGSSRELHPRPDRPCAPRLSDTCTPEARWERIVVPNINRDNASPHSTSDMSAKICAPGRPNVLIYAVRVGNISLSTILFGNFYLASSKDIKAPQKFAQVAANQPRAVRSAWAGWRFGTRSPILAASGYRMSSSSRTVD